MDRFVFTITFRQTWAMCRKKSPQIAWAIKWQWDWKGPLQYILNAWKVFKQRIQLIISSQSLVLIGLLVVRYVADLETRNHLVPAVTLLKKSSHAKRISWHYLQFLLALLISYRKDSCAVIVSDYIWSDPKINNKIFKSKSNSVDAIIYLCCSDIDIFFLS